MSQKKFTTETPRRVGRPNRLTLDRIVDEACAMGLSNLEMAELAARLNTGVGTLYGYIKNRDHLLLLAGQKLAEQAHITDRGQSWQDVLREHADVTLTLFDSNPALISRLVGSGHAMRPFQYSDVIINQLIKRGFHPASAAAIFIEVSQLLIGAATCKAMREKHNGTAVDPMGTTASLPSILGDHRPTLERIIESEEQRRAKS